MTLPLAVTTRGTGSMLVCHPGGPGMHPSYLGAVFRFADRHQVVLVHPRGSGDSPRPADPGAYLLEDYGADLIAWLEGQADGPVHLLGHSHGGSVVARVAAARPDLVRTVVLLATPAYGGAQAEAEAEALHQVRAREPACAQALATLREQADRYPDDAELGRLIAAVAPLWLGRMTDEGRRWQAQVATWPGNVDALRFFNEKVFPELARSTGEPGGIRSPLLAVCGDLDGWAGPAHLPQLSRLGTQVRSHVLEGAGHMCQVDAMDRILAVVRPFLLDHEKG